MRAIPEPRGIEANKNLFPGPSTISISRGMSSRSHSARVTPVTTLRMTIRFVSRSETNTQPSHNGTTEPARGMLSEPPLLDVTALRSSVVQSGTASSVERTVESAVSFTPIRLVELPKPADAAHQCNSMRGVEPQAILPIAISPPRENSTSLKSPPQPELGVLLETLA